MADEPDLRPKLYCPECRVGKYGNCVGQALDPISDDFVECSTQVKARFEKESETN